jgi:hypothetical protein
MKVRLVDGMGYSQLTEHSGSPIVVVPISPPRRLPLLGRTLYHAIDFIDIGEYDKDGIPVYRDYRTAYQRVPIRYPHKEERDGSAENTGNRPSSDATGFVEADPRPTDRRRTPLFGPVGRSERAERRDQG